jgi:hypothetical protein
MAKLKKNVAPLLNKGIESMALAIEIFNRPSEVAHGHAVLILLHHVCWTEPLRHNSGTAEIAKRKYRILLEERWWAQ